MLSTLFIEEGIYPAIVSWLFPFDYEANAADKNKEELSYNISTHAPACPAESKSWKRAMWILNEPFQAISQHLLKTLSL